jgi:hypothetical protein
VVPAVKGAIDELRRRLAAQSAWGAPSERLRVAASAYQTDTVRTQAMGLTGVSKSTVSKLCKDIDERVSAFLDRPLSGEWP